MASAHVSTDSTVPLLMSTVKQLAPADLREFQKQLAAWQQQNGSDSDEERTLVQTCGLSLPFVQRRRLKRLIAKSERGTLTRDELHDYRTLSHRIEQLDAIRLEALTRLARLWRKPVPDVLRIIGWEGGEDDTAGHPARAAKVGARPRR